MLRPIRTDIENNEHVLIDLTDITLLSAGSYV